MDIQRTLLINRERKVWLRPLYTMLQCVAFVLLLDHGQYQFSAKASDHSFQKVSWSSNPKNHFRACNECSIYA